MQFKKGDIICSDRFRFGLLMFVEKDEPETFDISSWEPEEFYLCTSLLNPKQTWCAYDNYNFRIATDDDIERELARYKVSSEILSSDISVDISDENIILEDDHDNFLILEPSEAIKLRDIINKYVGE